MVLSTIVTVYDYKIVMFPCLNYSVTCYNGFLKCEYNYDEICYIKIIHESLSLNDTLYSLTKIPFGTKLDITNYACIDEL
jgi:hypothetical protein